jgi:flagellar protein FlaG
MDLEIHGVKNAAQIAEQTQRTRQQENLKQENAKEVARRIAEQTAESPDSRTTRHYLDEILDYTQFFNKRLKFSVNEELNQVIVKVIDAQTDKVIKEIPPEVLQRLHVRIREAIGLLIDEFI